MSNETEWVLVPREPTPEMHEAGHAASLGAGEPMHPDFSGDGSLRWPCPAHPPEAQAALSCVTVEIDADTGKITGTRREPLFTRPAEAQGGGEVVAWRILWSPQFPETAELTSDGERVQKVRALDDSPQIEPLYTVPPSAPVGVERLVSQWRSGCISAQEAMISISQQPAAEVYVDFPQVGTAGPLAVVDGKVTLPDTTMNDLIRHARTGYVEQPAAVDDAMVERATMTLLGKSHDTAPGIDWRCDRAWTVNKVRKNMRAALTAALTAKQGGAK